ncbi:hypothetical protein HPB50_022719 [Hyalomma asiaticum]|uniref:Uncharacterized protein n=1 Tax=Hyalomma asiaticum TaxID=266040 RepID=A0ACB7S979_HYAAI|nr:hypothetical protein HPB50_022719 [Hyalomma asiaticum]
MMSWMRRALPSWQIWKQRRRCSALPVQKLQLPSHGARFREALYKAGRALEHRSTGLEETVREFLAGIYSTNELGAVLKRCGLEAYMVDHESGSNYREVGTLTDLFIRIQRKGVPPLEDTESARTNRRRLVSVAQMQQIANELINGIVTTTPDDRDNLERITAANKIKTLLSNALLALVFKIVADTSDIRLLDMFARSLELFSSSYFESEETDDGERKTVIRRWSRYQACNVEALANAFECSQLLARANVVELYAARQCGTNLALAIQGPREQRDIMDGMSNVIKELTDGVLGYLDECEASEATEALRDIAFRMRIT